MTKLVLASTSPARLRLLKDGGIDPIVIAPGVDEEQVADMALQAGQIGNTADLVLLLAKAKAEAVVNHPDAQDALIIGCDSSLDLDGESLGKPHDPEVAIERWKAMNGRSGRLYTGHWLMITEQEPQIPLPMARQLIPKCTSQSSQIARFWPMLAPVNL